MKTYRSLENPTAEKRIALRHEMQNKGFYFSGFDKICDEEVLSKNGEFKVVEELWIFEKREPVLEFDDNWSK